MKNLRVLSEDTTLEKIQAIRAYKYVEIFDELYDQGYTVLEIKRGFGRIKPKLYNKDIHATSL